MVSVVMLGVVMLSVVMQSVVMLSVIMLNVTYTFMLSVIMLSVVMLNVILLSVVVPIWFGGAAKHSGFVSVCGRREGFWRVPILKRTLLAWQHTWLGGRGAVGSADICTRKYVSKIPKCFILLNIGM
jgi:hypothetical protein